MRRLMIVVTAAAIAAGGGAWAAQAGSAGGTTPLRCMDTFWRTSAISTSSKTFTDVPGLHAAPASIFPIAIDVSAVVSGPPVEFRVLSTNVGAQSSVSQPGRSRFVPGGGGPDAFSFQWVEPNQVGRRARGRPAPAVAQPQRWRRPPAPRRHVGVLRHRGRSVRRLDVDQAGTGRQASGYSSPSGVSVRWTRFVPSRSMSHRSPLPPG